MGLDKLSKRQTVRNALRAAVAAAALSGASAEAQDAHVLSPTHVSRSEPIVSSERLDVAVRYLERALAPGGLFAKKLSDPRTSREEADRILKYVHQVIQQFEVLQVVKEQYASQKEALLRVPPPAKYFHGSGPRTFTSFDEKGKEYRHLCHGYYVALNGESYFATANHCVVGTTEEAQFVKLGPNNEDVAVQFLNDYRGPALTLDPNLDDATAQGKMVLVQGEKDSQKIVRLSFLIKMSPALYKKIHPNALPGADWLSEQAATNFMLIMQHGDSTADMNGRLLPQGLSGAVASVWVNGGYRAIGPFFAVRNMDPKTVTDTGLNSAMGYVVGIDALKSACHKARALADAPGWVARIKANR